MANINIYHVATFGDFEDYCYEEGAVLEVQACNLERALECFVRHFTAEDILGVESQCTGTEVVYTRGHAYEFAQKFGCPRVWGLIQVSEWEPEYENEWGEVCYGLTQEEYYSILESRIAEDALRYRVNTYLDR